jgi:hypothetical protein
MTKITADQLARQGRAAFVTATHTLRGKSGKESPGDKSFIRAKGIRLTKIGERSNTNLAYADERDIAGLFRDEIPVEQCLPSCVSGGGLPVHNFVGFNGTVRVYRPHVAAINHLPESENSELKFAKEKGWAA